MKTKEPTAEPSPEPTAEISTPVEVPPAAPPTVKRTVEAWALARGMLPQIFPGKTGQIPPGVQGDKMRSVAVSFGKLRGNRANLEFWKFAAAKAGSKWPEGFEVTEEEFDEAVRIATTDHQLR